MLIYLLRNRMNGMGYVGQTRFTLDKQTAISRIVRRVSWSKAKEVAS